MDSCNAERDQEQEGRYQSALMIEDTTGKASGALQHDVPAPIYMNKTTRYLTDQVWCKVVPFQTFY